MAFYSSADSFSILAEINTYSPSNEGFEYPFPINFISSDASTIDKNFLEVPPAETWEIGVTSVNYKVLNSKTILLPTPAKAKETRVYDLYCGEILFGPIQFFPINYPLKSCYRLENFVNVDIDKVMKEGCKLTDNWEILRARHSFEPLMHMDHRLYIGMFDTAVTPLQRAEFYARDMNTPPGGRPMDPKLIAEINANNGNKSYVDLSTYHSPILRWNFCDLLFKLYPSRFTIHSNTYGLFTLEEIWKATLFSDATLANANKLLIDKKVLGFEHHINIQDRQFFKDIKNNLPTFDVIKTIGQLKNVPTDKMQPYCTIKTPPTCMYIAMGSIMCRLSGFQRVQQTYEINTKTKKRSKLGIVINNLTDSFIGSCSLKKTTGPYPRMTPVYHHDGEKGAQAKRRQWLWKLPATNQYIDNDDFYLWVQDPSRLWPDGHFLTRTIESQNPLQFFNAGEIFIYCDNSVADTSHIGNYVSPLLEKIPAPTFAYGKTLMDTSYIDFNTDQLSVQLNIKNPIFKTLKERINLADARAQILNEYGEPIFGGVLTLELVLRRKGSQ